MAQNVVLSCYMLHGHLKRMRILLFGGGVFYKYQLHPISDGGIVFFFLYPYGFSVWPVVEKGMLKFSFIIVNLSIFSFNSIMFLLHIFTAIFVYTGTVCLGRLSLLTLYNVLLCLWSFSFLRSLLYMIFT